MILACLKLKEDRNIREKFSDYLTNHPWNIYIYVCVCVCVCVFVCTYVAYVVVMIDTE